MFALHRLLGVGRRVLADRLDHLQETLENLGQRLREVVAQALGQTVGQTVRTVFLAAWLVCFRICYFQYMPASRQSQPYVGPREPVLRLVNRPDTETIKARFPFPLPLLNNLLSGEQS